MKKRFALLMACLLLMLTACGTADTPNEPKEPTGLTAEDLPESCRQWFDIAANSGPAEEDSQLPFAKEGQNCTSEIYGVHMPDGSYVDLILRAFQTEGVTLEDFSGGGAKLETSAGRLAWNGERYDAFTIAAQDCAIPNLMPVDGGLLRLDISGECTIDGGGEPCFNGFDCVLITGDGTLTFTAQGLRCGGERFKLPALMIGGNVTVVCPDMELLGGSDAPVLVQLGGRVYTDRIETVGQVLVADGLLLARQMNGVTGCTFRGGVALMDEYNVDSAAVVMSGGEAYFNGELPKGTTIEGGAGTLAAANLAAVTAHAYDAALLDNEKNGSAYYQTAFSEEWAPVDGKSVTWDSLCAEKVEPLCWFGGTMKLNDAALEELLPWGALRLGLTGSNTISGELGGTSLLFTGDGTLAADKISVWGWGAVAKPVLVIRDGAEITVTGSEELAIGSNAEQEGLLLLEDGTLTCPALWLQNAALVIKNGTLHVTGNCSIEKGSITVEGGALRLDNGLWMGEGDITLTGGEIVTPGGEESLCLDNGTIHQDSGTIREP